MKSGNSTDIDYNTGKVNACRCCKRRNEDLTAFNYQNQNFRELFKRCTCPAVPGGILVLGLAAILTLDICSKLRN
jgi:hypothetical protein